MCHRAPSKQMEKGTRFQHFDLNWDNGGTKSEIVSVGFLYNMGVDVVGVFSDGLFLEGED
jgi:hypothetical protein